MVREHAGILTLPRGNSYAISSALVANLES